MLGYCLSYVVDYLTNRQHEVNSLGYISTNIVQSKLYDLCDYCRDNEINLTRQKSQPFNQNNLCRSNPISSLSIEPDRSGEVCRMFKLTTQIFIMVWQQKTL